MNEITPCDRKKIIRQIKLFGKSLGLQVGITTPQINELAINKFIAWLEDGHHGTMQFMLKHHNLRVDPHELMPGVKSIICCRLDYAPENFINFTKKNSETDMVQITPYAKCRDYHKIMRHRLQQLAQHLNIFIDTDMNRNNEGKSFQYRVFCDSAPIMEKTLAMQAGLGWIGKNTLLISKTAGSYSFLGEIYTDLDLNLNFDTTSCFAHDSSSPQPQPTSMMNDYENANCGSCTKCLEVCPTKALHLPYSLDAPRCIAYLTIEHTGAIAPELRHLIGIKIFGCNECQRCCPWNHKQVNCSKDQHQRGEGSINNTDITENLSPLPPWNSTELSLAQLFLWDETTYLHHTTGTPLRRLGYERWLRNLAIALGNSTPTTENLAALTKRINDKTSTELVREHIEWAILKLSNHQNRTAFPVSTS